MDKGLGLAGVGPKMVSVDRMGILPSEGGLFCVIHTPSNSLWQMALIFLHLFNYGKI